MQTDRGLVQHIEHAGQSAADLGGQTDALALATGKRARRPGKREIIQTHTLQELQTVLDLLHDLAADLLLLFGEVRLVLPDKLQFIPDRHLTELADVLIPDSHGKQPVRFWDYTHLLSLSSRRYVQCQTSLPSG